MAELSIAVPKLSRLRGPKVIAGAGGLASGLILARVSVPGFTGAQVTFLAVLLVVLIWWAWEVVPPGVAGVGLLATAGVLHLAPTPVIWSGFANPVLWLIVAGLILGAAANESGLGQRVADWLLDRIRPEHPMRLVWVFFAAGAVLTELIPTTFGRLAILLPVGLGIAERLRIVPGSDYGKFLFITIFFAAGGPYLATMTGYEPTLAAIGTLVQHGYFVSWLGYFRMWVVPGLFLSSLTGLACVAWLFRPPRSVVAGFREPAQALVASSSARRPWTAREIKVLAIFGGVLLCWVFGGVVHLAPTWPALAGAALLFAPGIDACDPTRIGRYANPLTILFLASALSLGPILGYLHLAGAFAARLAHWLPMHRLTFGQTFILGALVQLLHLPLSTVTAAMATVTAIYIRYGQLVHANPITLTWIVVASAAAYIFPYQNEALLMVHAEGYTTMWDMIKVGLFISVTTLVLVPVFASTWWAWTIPAR